MRVQAIRARTAHKAGDKSFAADRALTKDADVDVSCIPAMRL